jgi:hypothetical protein
MHIASLPDQKNGLVESASKVILSSGIILSSGVIQYCTAQRGTASTIGRPSRQLQAAGAMETGEHGNQPCRAAQDIPAGFSIN